MYWQAFHHFSCLKIFNEKIYLLFLLRLVELGDETNWTCYLQKGGYFYYFLNILQLFIHSVYLCLLQSDLVIDIFLRNHSFYLKGAGSLAEDLYDFQSNEDFFLGLKNFRLFYSLRKLPLFSFFLSFILFLSLLLRSRSMPGSVLLLSTSTTLQQSSPQSFGITIYSSCFFVSHCLLVSIFRKFFHIFGSLLSFFFFSITENQCFSNFKVYTVLRILLKCIF